jgi:dTDP-4-amino-4,6-dideoxygalactose transaminase
MAPGFKYNPTDVGAALGLAQLRQTEHMRQWPETIARRYTAASADWGAVQAPPEKRERVHAWHLYMLRQHLDRQQIDRVEFVGELKLRNIGVSVRFIPMHIHLYYRSTDGYRPEDYPVAYRECQREISLPI